MDLAPGDEERAFDLLDQLERMNSMAGQQALAQSFEQHAAVNFAQWQIGPNDTFMATGSTKEMLPAGVYKIEMTNKGILFVRISIITDDLIEFDDPNFRRVIDGIHTFWKSQDKYKAHGYLYKRGVMLVGPPGSGKTVTINFLMRDLVKESGIVLLCEHPELTTHALQQLRRVEPDRPLIVVEEDIEELVKRYGEHSMLALLDGENQIDNVVHLASTNFPELLGARFINRPSRFDDVVPIGMPSETTRAEFFRRKHNGALSTKQIEQWAKQTDNFSLAHCRELLIRTLVLGIAEYEENLKRLKEMSRVPKVASGLGNMGKGLGFLGAGRLDEDEYADELED